MEKLHEELLKIHERDNISDEDLIRGIEILGELSELRLAKARKQTVYALAFGTFWGSLVAMSAMYLIKK